MCVQNRSMDFVDVMRAQSPKPCILPSVSMRGYQVRRAHLSDSIVMQDVEKDAFPTVFPTTNFDKELRRSNAVYLIVTRPWTSGSNYGKVYEHKNAAPDSGGFMTILRRIWEGIFFENIQSPPMILAKEYVSGFVGVWFAGDEAQIITIGTRSRERRRGVGELLLRSAICEAIHRDCRELSLEVRKSNHAAQRLYSKYGFNEVGIRHRYYADNREDALILKMDTLGIANGQACP